MGLDLNKEITFGSKKAKKLDYPTKTSMNLYEASNTKNSFEANKRAVVLGIILFALLLVVFVVIPLRDIHSLESQLAVLNLQVEETNTKLVDYDKIAKEYQSYSGVDEQKIGAIDILNIIDDDIRPHTQIKSVDYNEGTVTVEIGKLGLKELGELAGVVSNHEGVVKVSISSTSKNTEENSSVLVIELVKQTPQDEEFIEGKETGLNDLIKDGDK